jgi:hypothetical protein
VPNPLSEGSRPEIIVQIEANNQSHIHDINIFAINLSRVAAAIIGVSVAVVALLAGLVVGVHTSDFPTKGFLGVLGVGALLVILAITAKRLPREESGSVAKWFAALIVLLVIALAYAGVRGFIATLSSSLDGRSVVTIDAGPPVSPPLIEAGVRAPAKDSIPTPPDTALVDTPSMSSDPVNPEPCGGTNANSARPVSLVAGQSTFDVGPECETLTQYYQLDMRSFGPQSIVNVGVVQKDTTSEPCNFGIWLWGSAESEPEPPSVFGGREVNGGYNAYLSGRSAEAVKALRGHPWQGRRTDFRGSSVIIRVRRGHACNYKLSIGGFTLKL